MIRRILAIAIVTTLLILLFPVKVTFTSEAAMVDDPFDVALAPHFNKVVYSLTEPSFSTSCDERGYFKALVGTPGVSISDSRLVVTPISSSKCSIVLSRTDVPEINQTGAYYETAFNASNMLSWTNISLYDLSNDWINISVHSGAFYYDYDSGTKQTGVLYTPAIAGVDYVVAFDLTTSSVTLFVYDVNGTLLADKYISDNRLVGGDLDEVRFEIQGSSSNILRIDYLYVLGALAPPATTSATCSFKSVDPNELNEENRVDLDPTSLTLEQSLRQEFFNFDDVTLDSQVTETEFLNALGQTEIHQQRAAGRLVAEGYKNLRTSIEGNLIDYIAKTENTEDNEVYLIDYYVDYIQCDLEVDEDIVDKVHHQFDEYAGSFLDSLGVQLREGTTTSSIEIVPAHTTNISLKDLALAPIVVFTDVIRGFTDPFGLRSTQDYWQDKFDDIYGDMLDRYDLTYNQTMTLIRDWQRSTDEKFEQVRQDYLNFVSISQAQVTQLVSNYKEMQDKFERTISKFYSYAENQFEATNAIIAKLLLQNEIYAETSRKMNEYFAGQLMKTNEVVLNITSAITNALSTNDFWNNVYNGGKPESEPLTFSGFFGNNVRTWILIFVGGLITLTVALILITMIRRKKRTRSQRR